MHTLGVIRIILQESSGQSTRYTVATYSYLDYYDTMVSENAITHFGHVDYTDGIVGKYYRARVTLYAVDDEGSELPFYITETVRCT